jgi:hypothetical protein
MPVRMALIAHEPEPTRTPGGLYMIPEHCAHITTACDPELYVAVTRQARQAGRVTDGKTPSARKDSWQKMAAKLDHFGPSRIPAAAPPDSGRFKNHQRASR